MTTDYEKLTSAAALRYAQAVVDEQHGIAAETGDTFTKSLSDTERWLGMFAEKAEAHEAAVAERGARLEQLANDIAHMIDIGFSPTAIAVALLDSEALQ